MAAESAASATMASAIGIDLGTTYSCVGVWENGSVSIIANRMGNRTTPSWVAYRDTERLTGEAARSQASRNPKFTLYDAKRMIGRKFSDPHVQEQLPKWPFKVIASDADLPLFEVKYCGETLAVAPEEVSSAVLKEMKQIAEDYMGKTVTDAVITVPAYFNDAQRQATKDAAEIAGLRVQRIINEPTAAALAYGFQKVAADQDRPQNLLIFDLGGGTLDVTILTVDNGVFEVRATCGDSQLGGQDFDNVLLEYFAAKYQEDFGENVRTNAKSVMKLKEKCTEAKHTLSSALVATIEVDSLYDGNDYDANITRAKFNELSQPLLDRCMGPVRSALADAAMTPADVDEVILVGGSTRIPEVQAMLERFFAGKTLNKRINPDEAVAFGAAIQAANLTLSTEQKAGSKLAGLTLLDVIPLSLGIELHNGKMSVLIPRNCSIPFRHSRSYYNNEDDQDEAIIEVFEGEHAIAASNRLLGKFTVGPLPHRPRGKLKINITFVVNADGILEVQAEVKDTDVEIAQVVKIDGYKGLLSREEVSAMAETAKGFDAAAEAKAERARAMDGLQQLVLRLQQDLKGLSELADAGKRTVFVQMLDEANVWIISNKNGAVEDIAEVARRIKAAWVELSGEREFA